MPQSQHRYIFLELLGYHWSLVEKSDSPLFYHRTLKQGRGWVQRRKQHTGEEKEVGRGNQKVKQEVNNIKCEEWLGQEEWEIEER